jgi:hypothetical protein
LVVIETDVIRVFSREGESHVAFRVVSFDGFTRVVSRACWLREFAGTEPFGDMWLRGTHLE